MLERVQTGELSPAEAATALLEGRRRDLPPGEPLDLLLRRLGPPPSDLQEVWCLQLRSIVGAYEQDTGQPLPHITLRDCAITSTGMLAWRDRTFRDDRRTSSACSRTCDDAVREFQRLLANDHTRRDEPTRLEGEQTLESGDSFELGNTLEVGNSERRLDSMTPGSVASPRKTTRRQPKRRSIRTGVLAACILLAFTCGTAYWFSSPRSPRRIANNIDTPDDPPVGSESVPVESKTPWSSEDFETLDSMRGEGAVWGEDEDTVWGEEFMAPGDGPSNSIDLTLAPERPLNESPSPAVEIDSTSAGDPTDLDQLDLDASDPAAMRPTDRQPSTESRTADPSPPQAVLKTVAVELPVQADGEQSVLLSEATLDRPTLDFPYPPPLALVTGVDPLSWQITDTRSDKPVAMLRSGPDGTRFKWLADASQTPHLKELVHARIVGATGQTVFLRRANHVDAMPIRVDRADVTTTWDLGNPIPPRASRITLSLTVPSAITIDWIEALDPSSLRRGQGVVMLKPTDRDDIALGIRFDTRCSKTLSCRIRYAARMGPSLPWQPTSTTLIRDVANRLTRQAMLISNEATRLSRVYELADSAGRRILRVKQNRNDALAAQVRQSSERIAAMQTLVATVETQAKLNVRVWVQWPDSQQDLLITGVSDRGSADEGDPVQSDSDDDNELEGD